MSEAGTRDENMKIVFEFASHIKVARSQQHAVMQLDIHAITCRDPPSELHSSLRSTRAKASVGHVFSAYFWLDLFVPPAMSSIVILTFAGFCAWPGGL